MKITRLRLNSKLVDLSTQDVLGKLLMAELNRHGYITENDGLTKIGLRMRSFKINTDRLGYNKRPDHDTSLVGFKRTDVPTWDQRVEFNNIINSFFDQHNLTAKITSGTFLIRCHKEGVMTEGDWGYDTSDITLLTSDDIEWAANIRKENAKKVRDAKRHAKTPPKFKLS